MNCRVCDGVDVAWRSSPQIDREVETPVSAVKVVGIGEVGTPAVVAVPESVTVATT
jgi:hypothetical protein